MSVLRINPKHGNALAQRVRDDPGRAPHGGGGNPVPHRDQHIGLADEDIADHRIAMIAPMRFVRVVGLAGVRRAVGHDHAGAGGLRHLAHPRARRGIVHRRCVAFDVEGNDDFGARPRPVRALPRSENVDRDLVRAFGKRRKENQFGAVARIEVRRVLAFRPEDIRAGVEGAGEPAPRRALVQARRMAMAGDRQAKV
ncbi:MAG: hypothetical protein V9G24_03670 [Rhodoblastus sp.]